MPVRSIRIFLASYLFIWFTFIIPGHRPGIITADGKPPECCCCCCGGGANAQQTPNSPTRASHCAICDFAAHLTVPPPVDLTLPPLCRCQRIILPAVHDLIARIVLNPFDGRGPPAHA